MDAHTIVIGVVIIILLYLLYLYFFGDSAAVLVGVHDASQPVQISPSSIAPGPTQNFTFSVWVYVSNWNAGAEKVVLNTFSANNMKFIKDASNEFGSSTISVSVDVKKTFFGKYKVYIYGGSKSIKYSLINGLATS